MRFLFLVSTLCGSLGLRPDESLGDAFIERFSDSTTEHAASTFRFGTSDVMWIGQVNDETVPQCKTFDPITGCAMCVVAVMDEDRGHARLNVTLDDVFKAIRDQQYPFLTSRFTTLEEVLTETGSGMRKVVKNGACMVRKSAATAQDVRNAYFNVKSTDTIVNLVTRRTPSSTEFAESELRYTVSERQNANAQFIANGGRDPTVTDELVVSGTEETYEDEAFDWQKKFIFTHDEPAEQNRPAHKVDYFMSCPCVVNDFTPSAHFAQSGSIGMGDYYKFNGRRPSKPRRPRAGETPPRSKPGRRH